MSASKARKIVELYREIEKRDSEIALLRANLELQQKSYEREIVLEVAAERERCAMVCELLPAPSEYGPSDASHFDVATIACADAIRAKA